MIEKRFGYYKPVCDICGESLPEESEFLEAVASMKHEGWQFKKIDGTYEHYCPDCKEGT